MNRDYDAIVVGARCAGSPTAMLLARQGYRILLVDRATFPSDTISTLIIHAPGVAALERWGVLDQVAASNCPPIERYAFDFGPFVLAGTPQAHEGNSTAYAPRRTVLDKILVDAAAAAGAEVREGFTLDEVIIEDGSVVGIAGHGPDGASAVERARVVIGADGWNSAVARTVGAERYNTKPVLETAFYSYWRGLPVEGMDTIVRGDRAIAAIPTNDDVTLVLVGCPYAQASTFRREIQSNYLAAFERARGFAKRIRRATQVERVLAGGVPNFFRRPFGPGWALVGDSGYTKDPITGQGISDAFVSAELCAAALADVFDGGRSFDDAMGDYWDQRDARALQMYEFTTQLATLEVPPEMQQLLAAIADDQAAIDGFVSVIAGTLAPAQFFTSGAVAKVSSAVA